MLVEAGHLYADTHLCWGNVLSIHLRKETTGDSSLTCIGTCANPCTPFVLAGLWVSGAPWRHRGRGKAAVPSDASSVSPTLLSVISCFVSPTETFSGRTEYSRDHFSID